MNINQITENIQKIIKSEKKPIMMISVAVVIIIILMFAGETDNSKADNIEVTTVSNPVNSVLSVQTETEEKLEKIIGNIKGVGNVKVMITLGSSGEYVYAENSRKESNGDKSSVDSEVVLFESADGNDEGLVISVKNPEILGVAVVCDGGESAVVRSEITNLIKSLFGIGADRVYVGSNAP